MNAKDKQNISGGICLDGNRAERNLFREVIFCEGKTEEHLREIFRQHIEKKENILGTRLSGEAAKPLLKEFPSLQYDTLSKTIRFIPNSPRALKGKLSIVAAGTSDVPVAEEAYQTARFYGTEAVRFYDCGVAGLHRLFDQLETLRKSDVIICIAGMEGALPSVLGGLVSMPIIACPTSIGYGVHFGGVTTLHAMLNSCSEGITVVNIDNGFGSACAALRILRQK